MSGDARIHLSDVVKRFGTLTAVERLNLAIAPGEVHAIMGPNGSGKSTLARVLAGHPEYQVTSGDVLFDGRDLLAMEPESRARAGMFMAFQYPVEIPGVSNAYFLKAALNAMRAERGEEEEQEVGHDVHEGRQVQVDVVDGRLLAEQAASERALLLRHRSGLSRSSGCRGSRGSRRRPSQQPAP